ncbi:MAG: MFS transporter [Anaerolineales bacterium]|jgi:DHA3 family macrolide efflux protein-like MFS transporter|nr:MFS transporter [Anaerolineales bacterium]
MNNSETSLPQNWAVRFFSIFTGQAFSLFGSSLVQFALIWHLTQATGSATVLAMASLFGMLPQILLGPIAGTIVDRGNRRLIMIFSDAMIAAATLLLAYLFWSNQVEIWHIYAALAVRSTGGAFHYPSMAASTSLMVPKRHLARVAGANQTLHGLVSIVAPPVGALLIAVMPTQNVLMIDVFTAMLGITPLLFFSIPQPERKEEHPSAPKASFLQDLGAGFKYMASWPGLLMLGLMATMLNFLIAPTSALTPLLVTKYFGKGALELGSVDSFFGVGMIAGGITLGAWGGFKKKIVTSLTGIALFSFAILAIAAAPTNGFWVMLVSMFLIGFMMPMVNGPIHALFQSVVEPGMQGRVLSLISSVAQAMMPLGFLIAGPITDATSYQTWFWVAGSLNLLIGLGGFFVPALMNIEDNHKSNQPAIPEPVQDAAQIV